MSYLTRKIAFAIAYIKKKYYLCSGFKTHNDMKDVTQSSYQGFGHRVQLIKRADVARSWAVVDNRRVMVSSRHEDVAKESFLNHVASIVRQLSLEL